MLVLVLAALLLGIHPSAGQVVGILVVAAGVMIVRGIGRDVEAGQLLLPLAVAVTIASYTLVDRSGIQHANAIAYFELSAVITLAYPVWIARRRGIGVLRAELNWATVVGGAAMFGAYCLVLAALRLAPPGPVAAVRESSVVIATALAAALLGEEVSRVRLLGAVLVAAAWGCSRCRESQSGGLRTRSCRTAPWPETPTSSRPCQAPVAGAAIAAGRRLQRCHVRSVSSR